MAKSGVIGAWFITVLLLLNGASAAIVNEVTIEDALAVDRSLRESITLRILDNTRDSFEFSLPSGATGVQVNGHLQAPVNGTVSTPLSCTECVITLDYTLSDAIQPGQGDYLVYSRTLNLPASPRRLRYAVALPPGEGVGSADHEPPIVPAPSTLETDGERVIIAWNELSPELPKRYYVSYHDLERFSTWQEIKKELGEWPVQLFILLALAIGSAVGFFAGRYALRRHRQDALPTVPSSLLSPDEKAILEALRVNGAPMGQKEVGKRLAWSKSKVSAIMTNLEYKKIVQREKVGRNYKVELIKDVEE